MDYKIVVDEINYWNIYFSSGSVIDDKIYEIAFFKIFVKFEVYLSNIFITYSIGDRSSDGYTATRLLAFRDKKHLEKVLAHSEGNYIDYIKRIQKLSSSIFEDNKDPFSLLFSDAHLFPLYNTMVTIRNYIAHESEFSKNQYIKSVLNNKTYVEPYEHLKSLKKGTSHSFYNYYINTLVDICKIINEPSPYFAP